MKLTDFAVFLLLVVCVPGCKKNQTPAAPPTALGSAGWLPTQAQPKLPAIKLYLGPETLDAEMAVTPAQVETGLMYRTNIDDQTAMIFVFRHPLLPPAGFWMTNCPVSLSAAYIGPDGVIEEIHHLEKNDNTLVVATNDNILYVLEVNDGWFARHNIATGTLIRSQHGSLAQSFSQ